MIFKITINADDEQDTVYVRGDDRAEVKKRFHANFGDVPDDLLEYTEVDILDVPDDEEVL